MYRTNLILKGINSKTGYARVNIEVTFTTAIKRERIYISTDEKIKCDHWNNGKVTKGNLNYREINRRIQSKLNEVVDILFEIEKRNGFVNKESFYKEYYSEPSSEKDILILLDEFLEIKELTAKYKLIEKLKTIRGQLKGFIGNRKVFLPDIDQEFVNRLSHYWQNKIGLQPNTIHKNFQFFTQFLNYLKKSEILDSDKYKYLDYPRSVETNTILLQKEEVKTIIQYNPVSPRLKRVKDLFLILIFTGLRFSDGVRISKRWVNNGFLNIHTQKTDEKISIPIHPMLRKILEKYDYNLQELKISNQKFNKAVKELCFEAGITHEVEVIKYEGGIRKYIAIPKNQLIASHTGRRTFITNSILAGIPLSVIQKITGHRKLTTLQKYVDIADGIKAEEMEKLSKYFN